LISQARAIDRAQVRNRKEQHMKYIIAILLIMASNSAITCTTFLLSRDGHYVFGRNYDWSTDAGMICTNARGLYKTSMSEQGNQVSWTSVFGSVTFNQFGKEFPMGGMNEAGLVVEVMWMDGSQYPEADDRAALNALQWIQYQLDNYSTVSEVINADRILRISQANPPLHFLIADSTGKAATIEFIKGKQQVHVGDNLKWPALTNSSYEMLMSSQGQKMDQASGSYMDNSAERFGKACGMIDKFKVNDSNADMVDYAFEILDTVKVPGFTQWSIAYDITERKVHFRTSRHREIKNITLKNINFDCEAPSLTLNLNQSLKENVNTFLKPFTAEENLSVIREGADGSRKNFDIKDEIVKHLADYSLLVKCNQ
jgi:penicillin V acylase-like amidase (Ntn superfamily)